MTIEAVQDVIRRAQEEPSFHQELLNNPDGALHGYDISYAERAAIISGDEIRLRELGLDEELSRAVGSLSAEGPINQ